MNLNLKVKCYKNIKTNYGSYILIFINIIFIILSILFYKCGYPSLEDKIKEIIEAKEEGEKNKNFNIKETIDSNKKKKKKKKKKKRKVNRK